VPEVCFQPRRSRNRVTVRPVRHPLDVTLPVERNPGSSRVYWAQDSYIGSAPKDALDMKDTIISGNVFAVAVDSTAVYWTDGNSVMRHTPK
jgi:hypothetical protein